MNTSNPIRPDRPSRADALAALLRNEQAKSQWARLLYSGHATTQELRESFREANSAYRGLYEAVLALTAADGEPAVVAHRTNQAPERSLTGAMDQLADREARAGLAHFLAGWFADSDPYGLEQALAAWEGTR